MSESHHGQDGTLRVSDLTPRECLAIRLLDDEWTRRELAMCFGIGSSSIATHARGECNCPVDCLDLDELELELELGGQR